MSCRNCLLGFALGVVAAHWLPLAHALALPLLCLGTGLLPIRRLRVPALALIGLGWAGGHAAAVVSAQLAAPCGAAGLVGRVVGLPATQWQEGVGVTQRFLFELETPKCGIAPGRQLQLNWLRGPEVRGGERWQLNVRLRAPRGVVNEDGFDIARWLLRREIAATGYVLAGERLDPRPEHPLATAQAAVDGYREHLRSALANLGLAQGGALAALTIGDGGAVPDAELARYRRTGTLHLLVVSGLHVGIVTALGLLVGRGVGRLLGVPANLCGVAVALTLAGGYVLLAGTGLSVVRAYIMSAIALFGLVAGRGCPPSTLLAYALAAVLVWDPMAPLAPGFWLSFGAVGVLLGYFAGRWPHDSKTRSALTAQLVLAVAFAPAAVLLTGLVHPLAPAINLVAVPAIGLVVLPLALSGLTLVATPAGAWLLHSADFALTVVDNVLKASDRLAPLYAADLGAWWLWLLALGATCLLPLGRLALLALASAAAALLLPPLSPDATLPTGEVRLTVLDVGQGTSVLVETAHHRLLYDAGPKFLSGGDMAQQAILPTLRSRGLRHIDVLMLSHADLDHVGGAASLAAGVRVEGVLAGEPVAGLPTHPCVAGAAWHWDGVDFAVLAPPAFHRRHGNDASCVLLVDTGTARALLPGDVGQAVEAGLTVPQVDVLLMPHHGSATSSSPALVAAARPRLALATNGYGNRFGHPHPEVVARYRRVGSHIVTTGVSGALAWRSDRPGDLVAARCRDAPYWQRANVDAARLVPCRDAN